MASEDVVGKTSATIANIAEEAKIAASENVKAPSRQTLLGISKSLVAGGVAGGVTDLCLQPWHFAYHIIPPRTRASHSHSLIKGDDELVGREEQRGRCRHLGVATY
nr:mitochondrial adenine nucleotide transporter ADNT1-like [Tanacetum cinerariifolium]